MAFSRRSPSILLALWLVGLFQSCLSLPTTNEPRQAQLQPLLTAAQRTPDLSKFYALFSSTGGQSGKPGPSLEERFNNADKSTQYTMLVPTNDAFASIDPAFLDALTSIPSYELLLSLLRSYILPGNLTYVDLSNRDGVESIEGFPIDINSDGSLETNEGMTQTEVPTKPEAKTLLDKNGRPVTVPASNGIIYKINNLYDPLLTYYGEDAPGDKLPPVTKQTGTMADILRQHQDLTELSPLLEQIDPDFINRLSLSSQDPAINARTVYLAPSNAAFEALPDASKESFTQPSNGEATGLFLKFGLGTYGEGDGFVRSALGFNIIVEKGRANNAEVKERVCAENGCVWLVGRWLDPLFGAFQ